MDRTRGHMRAGGGLYPAITPFDMRVLDVGQGHRVYLEQVGNPGGIPVVVLHGGPGGGCSPYMRRFFDPKAFRIILFDQRGCGRSRPNATLEANTTWHLVRDIELIRETLGIDAWHVFGGSWGSTLGLVYAQEHPGRVLSLILRGIFLMTDDELDWFYGGGAGRFWPELWDRFAGAIPPAERSDLIAAYHKRLFGDDPAEQLRFAQLWAGWENALASSASTGSGGGIPSAYALAFSRIEAQYFRHSGWLDARTHILNRMDRIDQIPGLIVQGRLDMICPPRAAQKLAANWPAARLLMVPGAGHAMSEPAISRALIDHMDDLAQA